MNVELQLDQKDFTMPPETPSQTVPLPSAFDSIRDGTQDDTRNQSTSAMPMAPGASTHRDGSDLLSRVVQSAHQTIDRLADTAAPHVQKLQDGMSSAGDTVSERAGQARDVSEEWAESLRSTVRENPLAAVAAALAVGLLVARITR